MDAAVANLRVLTYVGANPEPRAVPERNQPGVANHHIEPESGDDQQNENRRRVHRGP